MIKPGFFARQKYVPKERIGIANLIIFRVNRSNMKRVPFLFVSYQNKKTNDFFVHASPYSDCIAPVPLCFRRQHQAKQVSARAHHVKTCTYLRMKGMLKVIQ
ncbi:hypothetical protein, partial [Citrobacter sp.]|uniref:hypothetical protein n=1 Tax=Citrobacter sp. TaxID=1896336 RepID=UPI002FCA0914